MKVFTPSSCVSSMVSPYFFTLVKLSSGYTARLYRMLHATKKKNKKEPNHQISQPKETPKPFVTNLIPRRIGNGAAVRSPARHHTVPIRRVTCDAKRSIPSNTRREGVEETRTQDRDEEGGAGAYRRTR
jgi:hypothetical protein